MRGDDEQFMRLALACAAEGRGAVEPNPPVGAVIVRDGVEIARGWHGRFGGPHAEIEALSAARAAGCVVRGATMYVTLEPCCHHGKTPACSDALIAAGVARVVVAMVDPDEHVAGGGLAALREAGVEVAVGVCEAEARELLAAYVKLRTRRRPWVICKWAQTADGYLALPGGQGRWISSERSREHVHEVRGICDGVCVGVATVLADDPLLSNRSGRGRQPARLVLDSTLRTPPDCAMLRDSAGGAVVVATTVGAGEQDAAATALREAGAELLTLPAGDVGVSLPALLAELGRRMWTRLLVEGGPTVLRAFLDTGLADEILAYVAPRAVGADSAGLPRLAVEDVRRQLSLGDGQEQRLGDDVLRRFVVGAG